MTGEFKQHILADNLFEKEDKLLLAVSGGIDSVVLCELCAQAGFDFIIAHCNFQLRGEESERDEQFVKELGGKYSVKVWVKKFDTGKYIEEKKVSLQVAARELRYEWFSQLIETDKVAKYLLTAHHADDNAETAAMNYFRGTGLHGLTGMPAVAGHLRRPMLIFSRKEIAAFAQRHQLQFVEDSSNLSSKYTRNLFRNEILPLIEKVYPQVKENLRDNIRRFRETEQLYQFAVGELKKKLYRVKGSEVHIPVKQLLGFRSRALIFSVIEEYGFTEKQVDEVLKLAESESGKFIQSPAGRFRIIKHRHWFIISAVEDAEAATHIIDATDRRVQFDTGYLVLEAIDEHKEALKTGSNIAMLDSRQIRFPLILRKWKQGDYFYPLGMRKKKKVARFLIDQKLSKTAKENVWVLETNKKIIWVVGQRIDDRFRVAENTKGVLKITLV